MTTFPVLGCSPVGQWDAVITIVISKCELDGIKAEEAYSTHVHITMCFHWELVSAANRHLVFSVNVTRTWS